MFTLKINALILNSVAFVLKLTPIRLEFYSLIQITVLNFRVPPPKPRPDK